MLRTRTFVSSGFWATEWREMAMGKAKRMIPNSSVKTGLQVRSQNMPTHASIASVLFLSPISDRGCLLYGREWRG